MADPTGVLINIAIQTGLRLAIAALTPKQHQEGPRLDDLQLTTSTYGLPRPLVYGTGKVPGNVIWGLPIREEAITTDIGKGNPFSLGTQTVYKYYATLAVGICAREMADLVRIYADGKLIYAKDVDAPEKMAGLDFRFYPGSETQEVDPIMADHYGEGLCPAYRGLCYIVFNDMPLENFGNRIPQFQFVVSAAVSNGTAITYQAEADGFTDAGGNANLTSSELAVFDRKRNTYYLIGPGTGGAVLYAIDADSGAVLASQGVATLMAQATVVNPGSDPLSTPTLMYGADTPYLVLGALGLDYHFCVDKDTLNLVGNSDGPNVKFYVYFGGNPTYVYNADLAGEGTYRASASSYRSAATLINSQGGGVVVPVTRNFSPRYFFFAGSPGKLSLKALNVNDIDTNPYYDDGSGQRTRGSIGVVGIPNLQTVYLGGDFARYGGDGVYSYGMSGATLGYEGDGFTDVYSIHRSEVALNPAAFLVRTRIYYDGQVTNTLMLSEADSDLYLLPGVTVSANPQTLRYDPNSDTLVLHAKGATNLTLGLKLNSDGSDTTFAEYEFRVAWTYASYSDGRRDTTDGASANAPYGTFVVPRSYSVFDVISCETGQIVKTYDLGSSTLPDQNGNTVAYAGDAFIYDEVRARILSLNGSINVGMWPLETPISRGAETLKAVVDDICDRSKLSSSLRTTTALSSQLVKGYTIARELTFRAGLEPLATAYNFYGVEKSGKMVFDFKDGIVTKTISEDDMIQPEGEDQPVFQEELAQDAELPRALYIEYQSSDFVDETNVQGVRRTSVPASTMQAKGEVRVQLPLILSDTEAANIAGRMMYESWVGQEAFKFQLPQRYLDLIPNDLVQVTAEGRTEDVRIDDVTIGAHFALECTGTVSKGSVYSISITPASNLDADYRGRHDTVVGSEIARAVGFLLDMPLLLDGGGGLDRSAGALMTLAAGKAIGSNTFPGAGFMTSIGGNPYQARGVVTSGMAWGVLIDTMPDIPHVDWNAVQEETVKVKVIEGASYFTSATQADMIGSDANSAILYEPSTGKVEVIGFRDVAAATDSNGSPCIALTGFMRGKRGTDAMASGFTGTTYIIIANRDWLGGFVEDNALVGSTVDYVVVPQGQTPDYSKPIELTYEHRALKPYAPCHVTIAQTDPSPGQWTISWERRARLGGAWVNYFSDILLAEDSESYSIDILSGAGGSVVRTLSSTTTSVVYNESDMITDFGGVPAALHVKVYQISAQVGRGFANEVALSLE